MKINRLETHDRLLYFKKDQLSKIVEGLNDCLKKNPHSIALQQKSPYIYIFAFPKTADNGVDTIMFFQPRLERPTPQTNSYLFRAESNTDNLEICWMLPPRELWGQYKKGNVTENETVLWSISEFTNNREKLAAPFPDDFSRERINSILLEIAREMEEDARMKKLYIKPMNEEFSSI